MDWERCTEVAERIRESCSGVSFLSEVALDDEDLDFLCKNAVNIMFLNNSKSCILTAYIMVYAGRNYDRSYWPHLSELLGLPDINQDNRAYLMDEFDMGLSELGLSKDDVDTPRAVEKVLIHTVVPDKEEYMDNFFSFICSFYKDVLNFELPEDYGETFKLLSAIVKEEVKSDQLPSPYALNRCTVYALSNPANYDRIMIKILNIIDAGYKGRRTAGLGNNRFAIPFQKWYMNNIGSRSRSSLRKEMEMRRARMILSSDRIKILIPAMKCTSNANLIVKIGHKIVNEIPLRTFPIKFKGSIIHKMVNDLTLDPKEMGIDPYNKFQLEIDGHVVLSNSMTEALLFNENNVRIKSPNIGLNYILVKDPDIVPTCETSSVERVERHLYVCDLREGDELSVGGALYSVFPTDSSSEGINITPIEGIKAVSEMEVLPVCSGFDLLCIVPNATVLSKIYISITVDDAPPYHRPLSVSTNNINGGLFASRLSEDEHTSSGIHVIFAELYHNSKKVGDSKFLLIPGYRFDFDSERPVYVTESEGKLSYSGPMTGSIGFPTSAEYIDVPIPDSNISLRHTVPALRIRSGNDIWHNPGDYDMNFLDFIGDHLWVSCPCPSLLLYMKKPIPRHFADNCCIYDFHKMQEMYASETVKNIELEVSLQSKPRFHLCNIWTCNDYSVDVEDDLIQLTMSRHTANKVTVTIPESNESSEIVDDRMTIKSPECNGYSVIIKETDENGKVHTQFKKRFYKRDVYIENITDSSCKILCFDDSVELDFTETNLKAIMNAYDSKSRFTVWMKENRQRVIDCLRSIGIK